MTSRNFILKTLSLSILLLFVVLGCERDPDILEPAEYPGVPEVFIDGFSSGLNYAAFGGSRVDAFDVDTEVKYSGTSSMKIEVPDFEDPYGAYAGGVYYTSVGRNLSDYNALTFWAKASQPASIDIVGIGNDLGASTNLATLSGLKVNTNWQKYYIPIPDPAKWTEERGMFFYSEGPENQKGYTIWIDEVKFEKTGLIAHSRPSILEQQDQNIDAAIGDVLSIGGTFVTYNFPDGTDRRIDVAPSYFTYISSDVNVATVNEQGQITPKSVGTAKITAKLGSIDAEGSITVNVGEALPAPSQPAPTPDIPAEDVISLFSNAYTNVPVDVWATYWEFSTTEYEEVQIAGNDVKLYTKLNFNGIEFTSQTIDASAMTRFHMDIWTPDETDLPAEFKVLLVDFGANGTFDGGDDVSHELTFTANTSPALATGEWVSIDVPLSAFTGLTTKQHLAQLVISGDPNTVYVDNVYFYDDGTSGGGGGEPTEPAPTPTASSNNVISIYSDAYINVSGTNFFPGWGQATTASEVIISGNNTLKYAGLNYQGIELANSIDVSGMSTLHVDIWTENSSSFNIYLISSGPVEQASAISVPTQGWLSVEIPLTSFGSVDLTDVIQIKSDGNGDIYLDNIYFSISGGGNEPSTAAPTPTYPTGDVISLFSDAYTNNAVDTWSADWDNAEVSDIQINGNNTKLYSSVVFAGVEFTSQTVDASGLTHFRMDIWTLDPTALPNVFKIKLVDFGADGSFSGGDDVEHELVFDASTTPALVSGQWVSFDIPLNNFTGLTTVSHLAQLIFVSETMPTIYVDNVLFHK